jgi:hypothetical protein
VKEAASTGGFSLIITPMKSARFAAGSIPIVFAIITILAYGLLLPVTGFYWDDWPFAWIAKFLGSAEFIPAFRGFRPFLAPIFLVTTSLIPTNPLLWQIFALLIRWLSGLAAWFALNQVWPNHKRQALFVVLLFLVFPGYSQHWVALTHINQEWIPFLFYLLSFGFTARALRTPEHYLKNTIYALLLLGAGLFPTEYFVGLEPLRFVFIWVILGEETQEFRPRFIRLFKCWWPYLLIWIADAIWLVYYYKSGAYISYDVTALQAPAAVINNAFLVFGDALWKAGLYVWAQVLVLTAQTITTPTSLVTLALIAGTFLLSTFYLSRLEITPANPAKSGENPSRPTSQTNPRTFAIAALICGVGGILLGRIPSFAAGLPLTLQSSFDRFMISMMLGGSLFIAGAIEYLIRSLRVKTYLFALLIALGIGQQFFNANIFRRDWQGQQEIYWQFAWRIPALKPDTAIITQQMPLDYETDLSMTAAINWMYAAEIKPPHLPYALIYSEKRIGGQVLPDLTPDTKIKLPYRTVTFNGSTSQAIVIYVPPNGCLRVLDPAFDDALTYAKFPESLTAPIPLSDPSRILTDAASPTLPNPPFIKEPPHAWCYYYEKAELARQTGNWDQIIALRREADQKNLAPQDAFEELPFIEAYARTGDWSSTEEITGRALKDDPKIQRGVCLLFNRVQAAGAGSPVSGLLQKYNCGQ